MLMPATDFIPLTIQSHFGAMGLEMARLDPELRLCLRRGQAGQG